MLFRRKLLNNKLINNQFTRLFQYSRNAEVYKLNKYFSSSTGYELGKYSLGSFYKGSNKPYTLYFKGSSLFEGYDNELRTLLKKDVDPVDGFVTEESVMEPLDPKSTPIEEELIILVKQRKCIVNRLSEEDGEYYIDVKFDGSDYNWKGRSETWNYDNGEKIEVNKVFDKATIKTTKTMYDGEGEVTLVVNENLELIDEDEYIKELDELRSSVEI
jgi:hypothetical protein